MKNHIFGSLENQSLLIHKYEFTLYENVYVYPYMRMMECIKHNLGANDLQICLGNDAAITHTLNMP